VQQKIVQFIDGQLQHLMLPDAAAEVLPGIPWGLASTLLTPAYWAAQIWHASLSGTCERLRWSNELRLEIAACLLGGHGITYEMNRAAFSRLRVLGLLDERMSDADAIREALMTPLQIGCRSLRYRFPKAKSRFLHEAMTRLDKENFPSCCAHRFREWLMTFSGIGIKTASWVTRNFVPGAEVAVLDVHILRVGVSMNLFPRTARFPRDYLALESRFIELTRAIGADPGKLDALMWTQARQLGAAFFSEKLLVA
jgi:thermostable 8-oxoguanine DNA glycosylase